MINWHGQDLPFLGRSATILVPAGGVVRVSSLAGLAGNGDVRAVWGDGVAATGFTGGRAPAGTGATSFVAYQWETGGGFDPTDELPTENEQKFAHYLVDLEGHGAGGAS